MPAWARWVRPWTLVAWIFLTLGIAMGSYWAYYELGWGGWWFWDPVENASLMPWLAGTALLHSAVVMEKRNALKVWTILLSILTFSLSLLGTFLVRSGVLTSVHAFATDPARGVFILLILCLFIGGSLSLYAWRASALKQGGLFAPISREGALVLNNLFLTTACATGVHRNAVSAGAGGSDRGQDFGRRAVLQPDLRTPVRAVAACDAVRPAAGMEARRSARRGAAADGGRHRGAGRDCGAVCVDPGRQPRWRRSRSGLRYSSSAARSAISPSAWRCSAFPLRPAIRRGRGLPRATWGTAFAHAGVGIALIGIVCETTWNSEYIGSMKPNDVATVAGYQLKLDDITQRQGPNFREMIAQFTVSRDGETLQRNDAVEAQLHHPGIVDHRGRAADARRQPALYFARRHHC